MSDEIDLVGLKVPQSDWDATPESIKLVVLSLLEQLKLLDARVGELEEQLRRNSKNSSQPPSQDEKGSKGGKGKQTQQAQKKVFGFKPRKGKRERESYPPEECQSIQDVKPSICRVCSEALSGEDPQPYRHQTVDLPVIKPQVQEYRLHQLECVHCGATTRAKVPPGVSSRCYGPRVAGWISLMSSEHRQSHRKVSDLLREGFGIRLSRGSINRARQEVSDSVAAAVTEGRDYAVHQPVANCDETGFAQRNQDGLNPHNRRGWLWVVVTPLVTFFTVALSRSKATAKEILGEDFEGYLGSDRYCSYNWLDPKKRQLCWAHLLRDVQAMAERCGASREIGDALLGRGYRLFHWWHRVRDGTLSQELFIEAVARLRVAFVTQLESAAHLEIGPKEKTPLAKTVRTCAKILELEEALWTFVYVPGVEPTNNRSEQALRPAVIWQYTSFGAQSKSGAEFVERMLTVNATLKAQKRSILEFLTQSCHAARLGIEGPSLLPQSQTIMPAPTPILL
jgi:transposase